MAVELFVNDPGTTLASGCNSSDTTIAVVSSNGYPASGNFRIKIENEIMIVTAVSGNNWTVTRGAENTTATAHIGGTIVNHLFTAGAYKQALADRNCYVIFRAALSQNNIPSIGFSSGSDGPSAVNVTTTNGTGAAAAFAAGSLQRVYDHFMLPSDWAAPISLDILWRTSATTGNVTWQIEIDGLGTGATFDPTYNTAATVTTAANGTTLYTTLSNIASIDTTGITAGQVLYFRFARRGDTDTCAAAAELLELRFTLHRTP